MPDDNYAVIDRSSITRAAGGLRTLCRECQHLRSDVLLLFSSGHLNKEQSTVFTALLKGTRSQQQLTVGRAQMCLSLKSLKW